MPWSRRQPRIFWDKERLAAVGWKQACGRGAPKCRGGPDSLDEAARRINALLGELKISHTGLLTPDDVDYYILLAVFGGAAMPQEEFDDRFWGAGVTYRRHRSFLRAHRRARLRRRCCWKARRPSVPA